MTLYERTFLESEKNVTSCSISTRTELFDVKTANVSNAYCMFYPLIIKKYKSKQRILNVTIHNSAKNVND